MNIYTCARAGDLNQVKFFTEEVGVELNVTDEWDGTPLYYACLGGHIKIVEYLLSRGARCREGTFDGERCLYVAHTAIIRHLLRSFKQVHAHRHDPYSVFLRRLHEYPEKHFADNRTTILAHKAILAARSPYFLKAFQTKWRDSEIIINTPNVTCGALKVLFQFFYTNRIDLPRFEWPCFKLLLKQMSYLQLIPILEQLLSQDESSTVIAYDAEGHLKALLNNHFNNLLLCSNLMHPEMCNMVCGTPDVKSKDNFASYFPDTTIKVDEHYFFCHKAFLCVRSDYFNTLLNTEYFIEHSQREENVVELSEVSKETFCYLLHFIYTDNIPACETLGAQQLIDILYAADMYLIPRLKNFLANYLSHVVGKENVLDMYIVALDFKLTTLESETVKFMATCIDYLITECEESMLKLVTDSSLSIKNRQEIDTIPFVDEIRSEINLLIERESDYEEQQRLTSAAENFQSWLEKSNFEC